MLNAHYIGVLFRFINFGTVIFLVAYLCKKKIIPFINNRLKEQAIAQQELEKEQELLVKRQQELMRELALENQHALIFKSRIDQWKEAVIQENYSYETEKAQRYSYVQKQGARRAYQKSLMSAYDKIKRDAVGKVKEQVENKLANKQTSDALFFHLIHSLEERKK